MTTGLFLGRHNNSLRCWNLLNTCMAAHMCQGSGPWGSRSTRDYTSSSTSTSSLPSTVDHEVPSQASLQLSQQVQDASSLTGFAAQPLEPLWQYLNPVVLGSSAWELVHSSTGLPWWASIPLTTLALRTALAPLTIKAKSATLNWILLQNSFQTANRLLEQMQLQQGSAPVAVQQHSTQLKKPGKLKLVGMYYRYFRRQHRTTSMWWWTGNAVIQVNVFIVMSAALRNMSAVQWPGFTSEGIGWFTDLTQPAVCWGTLQCPYGVAGAGLPFLLLWLYKFTIDRSPVASHPRLHLVLDLGVVPVFVLGTMVPQATLLYWLGNSLFFCGMQEVLKQPRWARRVGIPTVMLPPPRTPQEEKERAELQAAEAAQLLSEDGSESDGFLRSLVDYYLSRGKTQQAMQCLQRLTVLAPGDRPAFSALGRTAAELEQWPVAAAAYERSAELCAVAGDQDEQATELVLAGKHWLNAAAEARHLRKQAAGKGSEGSSKISSSDAGGATAVSASAAEPAVAATSTTTTADQQQEYLEAATRVLHAAVALPSDTAADGWYLLATAKAAADQPQDALAACKTYWSKACSKAESDPSAKNNAAVKVLPVLASVAAKCSVPAHGGLLVHAAELAAEVAEAAWDRQSLDKLQEVLDKAAKAAHKGGRFTLAEQLGQLKARVQALGTGRTKLRGR